MKIGIISDVHSNIDALNAVLDEFEKKEVEKIICIGDVIGIGPYPEECINRLLELENELLVMVRGNHENYLVKGLPKTDHNIIGGRLLTEVELSPHKWNHKNLSENSVNYIIGLKDLASTKVGDIKIYVEHYSMNENYTFRKYSDNPSEEDLEEKLYFDKKGYNIYLFGHTHIQYFKQIGDTYYINPGSVGCPKNTQCACAGIIDIDNGEINYEPLKVKYDVEKVMKEIKKINYPLCMQMMWMFYK